MRLVSRDGQSVTLVLGWPVSEASSEMARE